MTSLEWSSAPVGIDASRWVSRAGCRTVLVVTHTIASCQRLLDVVEYVESDPRVKLVFTVRAGRLQPSGERVPRPAGAFVLPGTRLSGSTSTSASPPPTAGCTNCTRPYW